MAKIKRVCYLTSEEEKQMRALTFLFNCSFSETIGRAIKITSAHYGDMADIATQKKINDVKIKQIEQRIFFKENVSREIMKCSMKGTVQEMIELLSVFRDSMILFGKDDEAETLSRDISGLLEHGRKHAIEFIKQNKKWELDIENTAKYLNFSKN